MEQIKEPVNVVCFYWNGSDRPGWTDRKLAKEYILKLYNGFNRNTTVPFTFHCITTLEPFTDSINFISLEVPSYLGCLPKFSVFNPNHNFKGRVFACDLDVVVTGNVDAILSYSGTLATRSTFKGRKESGGDMVAFEGGQYSWIWEEFINNTDEFVRFTEGRERWIYRYHSKLEGKVKFLQDIFPDQIFSYKNHIRRTKVLPNNARLVSCHGKPRPHQINEDWIKDNWI